MLNKQFVSLITVALSVLSVSEQAFGRYRWLERDNRPVFLHPRRFGQENPEVLSRISAACPGEVCGVLAGRGPGTLLGAAGECEQQDLADDIIDAAQQFDDATKQSLIDLAVEFRQVEKNTPPDFTTNPPTLRNSVFCQTAPRNAELDGLVQAQDPANDPDVFFDPALGASVARGSQPNTIPLGSSGSVDTGASASADDSVAAPTGISAVVTDGSTDDEECTIVTVTVSGDDAAATSADSEATATVSDVDTSATVTATATDAAETTTSTGTTGNANIGDFGTCSVPEIEFGVGFDNRKETSFQPVDQASFNHGSAQAIGIITQFICDTLTNSCGADDTAKATCETAKAAADAETAKTGAQADAFNAAFGIQTNFADVQAVDDQGNVVAGTGSGAANDNNGSNNNNNDGANADDGAAASASAVATATAASTAASTTSEAAAAEPTETAAASDNTGSDNNNNGNSNTGSDADTGATGGNLQAFNEALGGVDPPVVTDLGNGQFQVEGNSSFNNLENALRRSCDVQNNQCANAANSSGNQGDLTVANCNAQQSRCLAQASSAA